MTVQFLLFDLDGTLIDSYEALTTALNRTGESLLEQPLTVADVKGLVGEGVERLLQKAFGDGAGVELVARFEEEYEKVCRTQSRILDEVEETLATLQERGFEMAVCTNKPTPFSQAILDHMGLAHHFRAVVGPDLTGARKPDPAHVLYTLSRIGGNPDQAYFIGDMPIDVVAARAANIRVAAIATGSATAEELAAAGPDILLQRFSHLVDVVSAEVVQR